MIASNCALGDSQDIEVCFVTIPLLLNITSGHTKALGEKLVTLRPLFDVENLCFNWNIRGKFRIIRDEIWILHVTSLFLEDR